MLIRLSHARDFSLVSDAFTKTQDWFYAWGLYAGWESWGLRTGVMRILVVGSVNASFYFRSRPVTEPYLSFPFCKWFPRKDRVWTTHHRNITLKWDIPLDASPCPYLWNTNRLHESEEPMGGLDIVSSRFERLVLHQMHWRSMQRGTVIASPENMGLWIVMFLSSQSYDK